MSQGARPVSVRTKVVAVIVILWTATVGAITVMEGVARPGVTPDQPRSSSSPLVRADFHHRYFAWKGWLAWVSDHAGGGVEAAGATGTIHRREPGRGMRVPVTGAALVCCGPAW